MSMNLDDMDGGTGQRLGRQPGHGDIEARRQRFDPGFNLDSVSYITHDTSISENIRLCVNDNIMSCVYRQRDWAAKLWIHLQGSDSEWAACGEESECEDQTSYGA